MKNNDGLEIRASLFSTVEIDLSRQCDPPDSRLSAVAEKKQDDYFNGVARSLDTKDGR
jgi:hypothetical protein